MKRLFVLSLIITLFLTSCSQVDNADDYKLLVLTFGKSSVDMHENFGAEPLAGAEWVSMSSSNNPATREEAELLILGTPEDPEYSEVNSFEFIGENDSFYIFYLDAMYRYVPGERLLARIAVYKDWSAPLNEPAFRTRESAMERLREVVDENVEERFRRAVLERLTAKADEMHSNNYLWGGFVG
ncbi:MAG: hypothetical protein FWD48_02115 [Oscillospiraceae bacterium]|nr:hypothetical protein [Oscillospiraceae bacterium]